MIFFEINFRPIVEEASILSSISEYYSEIPMSFYGHAKFYNESVVCPDGLCCFVFDLLYSKSGFKTFFKGEVYKIDNFSEIDLAIHLAQKLDCEVVIGDFTKKSSFLLINPSGKIYRVAPIGIGDDGYNGEVFEIDYNTLSYAIDLKR